MKRVILFSSLLISITVNSQISRSAAYDQITYLKRESFMASSADSYKDVKGSPYLYDGFQEGVIYTRGGDIFPGEYRFDIYANRIQFLNSGVLFQIAYPDSVSKIEIGLTTLKYVDYLNGEGVKKGFMVLIEEGEFTLLEQRNKDFYEALPAKPYQEPAPARFGNGKSVIYLKAGNNPAERAGSSKDIVRICGNRGNDAKDFISKEKINVKKVDDLRILVSYLNK